MKRMHALPIELPLVASGEYSTDKGGFILDNSLKLNKNYLIYIASELESGIRSSCFLNTSLIKGSDTANQAVSTAFGSTENDTTDLLYLFGNEMNSLIVAIGSGGTVVEGYLCFVYELPFSITLP